MIEMKLTTIKINFQIFGMTGQTIEVDKPADYTVNQAARFLKKHLCCDTLVVYSIEIEGTVIENPKVKAFEVVGTESEKYLKKKGYE